MKGIFLSSLVLAGIWGLFVTQLHWSGWFPQFEEVLRRGQVVSRLWYRESLPYTVLKRRLPPRRVGPRQPPGKGVRYTYHRILGRSVHVVRVNLTHPQVRLQLKLARGGLGHAEPFGSMIRRVRPLAAINAAFFSLQNLHPVGNLGLGGRLITQAPRQQPGTTLTLRGRNRIEIVRGQFFSLHYVLNQGKAWREKPARNHILGINTPLELRMPRDTIKAYTRYYGPIADIGPFGRAVVVEDGKARVRLSGPRVVIPPNGFVLAALGHSVFTKVERIYEDEDVRLLYWDVRRRRFVSPGTLMVGAGPKLLSRGRVIVDAQAEGFRHNHVFLTMARSALGLTRNGKTLLLVTIPGGASLQQEARILKTLGCWEAMNLDGGASTALYALGRIITSPTRPLTNWLVVNNSLPPLKRSGGGFREP